MEGPDIYHEFWSVTALRANELLQRTRKIAPLVDAAGRHGPG